jgi:signal transduction histidine kinase/ligand-binding sensor domain-containing protein
MRSIDAAPKPQRVTMRTIALLLAGVTVSVSGFATPPAPELSLEQLNHRAFTDADGAPGDIEALAQTSDGTLWIGSYPGGLTRFDGERFTRYTPPAGERLQGTNVSSLFVARDGALWIGFRPQGVSVLKDGHVRSFGVQDGLPFGTVQQFAEDVDGSIWAVPRQGLARFDGQHWETVARESEFGAPYGVLVDRAGTLWVATINGLRARAAGETRFREVDRRSYSTPRSIVLTTAPNGEVWAAADDALVRIVPATDSESLQAVVVDAVATGPVLFESDGSLWGTQGTDRNLVRVRAPHVPRDAHGGGLVDPERLSLTGDLTLGRVLAFFADREHNVWVGTRGGLHRFSRSNVVRDTAPPCIQNDFVEGAIVAGEAGSLWVACDDGTTGGHIRQMRSDGAVIGWQNAPFYRVAYRDPEGTLWFGGFTGIAHMEGGRFVTTPTPPLVTGRPIQALLREPTGAMWVSVSRRGTYRVIDDEWTENGGLQGLPLSEFAYVEAAGEHGTLWFGYTNNRVARIDGQNVQMFDRTQGLDVGNVMAILADSHGTWVGGELGLARFDGARFVPISNRSGEPFMGISGIVRARDGDLWLNGGGGIAHIPRAELDRVLDDPDHSVESETFNQLDGVPGYARQLSPLPSAVETTDGRIWFSMTGGIVSIDSTRLVRNSLPPPVTIWSVTSGNDRHPNFGTRIELPVHTNDIQIDYSAGSLTVPERVRFRYKLEGLDRYWQDVGDRREAHYTNLASGKYKFRVTASNNDGVWNNTGASIDFAIAPAFYQTGWFYALCALASAVMLAALYRIRMQHVAAQIRGRLEERLAERERIARELHDTLLQGMQGLIWRFQAATDRIPPSEPARQLMEQSLDRADQLLGESRDKVKDLRPAARDVADLAEAIAAEGEQLSGMHPAVFRVSVLGAQRELHPIVREEGFLVAREALANAFLHAHAAHIEAELYYDKIALHVRVRDDGQGIETSVLDEGGVPGHFGLVGMRERARKLGASLDVWSKPGAGTEIDLRVPANVAYARPRTPSRRGGSGRASVRSSKEASRV